MLRLPACILTLTCLATFFLSARTTVAGSIANLLIADLSSAPVFEDNVLTGIKRETQSAISLLSSNLIAPMPTFSVQHSGLAAADTELPSPTQTAQILLHMRINFDIVALPAEVWSIDVDQTRNFALTLVADPPTNGFQSQAIVDMHSASYATTPGGAGGLQLATSGGEDTTATFGNIDVPVNQSVSDTINGVGPTSVQLDFQQRLLAHSFANDGPTTVLAPGQEAAVRFGLLSTLTGVSADDYPGPGSRAAANDGHFVDVKVTFAPVPEPGSLVLVGLCVCGFGAAALRRRLG